MHNSKICNCNHPKLLFWGEGKLILYIDRNLLSQKHIARINECPIKYILFSTTASVRAPWWHDTYVAFIGLKISDLKTGNLLKTIARDNDLQSIDIIWIDAKNTSICIFSSKNVNSHIKRYISLQLPQYASRDSYIIHYMRWW